MTVQGLISNSQDTSAFYLGNIYEVLADPNATRPSPVAKPPPFSPPRYVVWVNSLWFLSLVISLTCALLATSLHQWSRRYIRVAQLERCSPEKRARMRAFFAEGVDKMHIPWAVEGLPMLLHLSVFLFFGGLVIFLFDVNHAVFSSVIWWIGLFSIVYGLITVMPILRHDSPYYAPLSRSAWFLYAGMNYVLFKVLASKSPKSGVFVPGQRFSILKDCYRGWMLGGVEKAAEETMSEQSSAMDIRIFDWTIGVLGEDDSLEKFFEAIPGLFSSKMVKSLESDFSEDILNRFWSALDGFMNRTLSSNSVIESVKARRIIICRDIMNTIPYPITPLYDAFVDIVEQTPEFIKRLQAMVRWRAHVLESTFDALVEEGAWETFFEAVPGIFSLKLGKLLEGHLSDEFWTKFKQGLNQFLDRTLSRGSVSESVRNRRLVICLNAAHAALGFDGASQILWGIASWPGPMRSIEMALSLRNWNSWSEKRFTPYVQRIVAQVVVDARERDDRWISLVEAEFAISGRDLRSYIARGDNVLLFVLIHVTRQAFNTGSSTPFVLSSLSEFNTCDTLPTLQHDFCALWNDILFKARDQEAGNAYVKILREIRRPYIDLHLGTDVAPKFPAATHYFHPVLVNPWSYRYCNIASHRQELSVYASPHIFPSLTDQSQAEEAGSIVEPPSSADYTPDPNHTQGFTPLLLTTNSVHITHATSSTSIPESTGDPDRVVPGEASRNPCQSAPSSAEIAATNFVRSDDPPRQIHIDEPGETYQFPVVPSLPFQHPDLFLATVNPPTGPDQASSFRPSGFVPDPGDGPDALQDAIPFATQSHPFPSLSLPSPTIVASDSLSPLIPPPTFSSGMTTAELPLFVDSSPMQPDHPPHALQSLSPSPTTSSSPQVTSRIVTSNPHDDSYDLDPPIPMTLLPHLN